MDIVALTEVATPLEALATLLAAELSVTPFEARQTLAAGVPCVVLMTADRARALSLLGTLRAHGHGALACEGGAVTPSSSMVPIRRFRFDGEALVTDAGAEPSAEDARVPFADLVALLRATHRHQVESREETKEKKFRPGAAIVTGGLILTKTVKREVVRTSDEREQVLYLFRRGGPPCLLQDSAAHYGGLGEHTRPTRLENFTTTVRLLREHAPAAAYDERLLAVKKFPAPPTLPGSPRLFDVETGGVDLVAHILAAWLSRRPTTEASR